ncbi:MAG: hypothetical protein NTV80_12040, partial [Verrucomicrobia bacterium]|nr:hypothetical protein [Verrucomicrobiota bacterium]
MPRHEIPEPECHATLIVSPDFGGAYLWDMNSYAITVSCVTNAEYEPLDDEFEAWQAIYENTNRIKDAAERKAFNDQGEALARKMHAFFGGT